jgi:hypothetical protein
MIDPGQYRNWFYSGGIGAVTEDILRFDPELAEFVDDHKGNPERNFPFDTKRSIKGVVDEQAICLSQIISCSLLRPDMNGGRHLSGF